jgi:hypothetical protein
MRYLHRILDVCFWTDYGCFTPESSRKLRRLITAAFDPERTYTRQPSKWLFPVF